MHTCILEILLMHPKVLLEISILRSSGLQSEMPVGLQNGKILQEEGKKAELEAHPLIFES